MSETPRDSIGAVSAAEKGDRLSVTTLDGTVVHGTVTDVVKSDDGFRVTLTMQWDESELDIPSQSEGH